MMEMVITTITDQCCPLLKIMMHVTVISRDNRLMYFKVLLHMIIIFFLVMRGPSSSAPVQKNYVHNRDHYLFLWKEDLLMSEKCSVSHCIVCYMYVHVFLKIISILWLVTLNMYLYFSDCRSNPLAGIIWKCQDCEEWQLK